MADTDNNRITAEREFLWMFWRRGLGRRQRNKPLGVAVDACDMVYVVTSFEELGAGPEVCHDLPCGLVVDISGVVYVCETIILIVLVIINASRCN